MDWRQYDPALARWVVIDLITHHSTSPYSVFENDPVYWADPSGMTVKTKVIGLPLQVLMLVTFSNLMLNI
jgi:hypothetical protein